MLNVNIVCHGTLKEKYLRDAIDEYSKRLGAYCVLNIYEGKDDAAFDKLCREKIAEKKDYKIALCVEGKQVDSPGLADMIKEVPLRSMPGVTFVIGGSDGLPEEVKSMCHYRLSFSKMTFPHQLMRVILVEQIYRAFTIMNNGKYHK